MNPDTRILSLYSMMLGMTAESQKYKQTESYRTERMRELSVKLSNNLVEEKKLRKKIAAKNAKKDRKAIELTAKLAQVEMQNRAMEAEVLKLLG